MKSLQEIKESFGKLDKKASLNIKGGWGWKPGGTPPPPPYGSQAPPPPPGNGKRKGWVI
ncbi:MAG: hypothetical protein AB8G11_12615 [Saprospiraceae bacterium]